MHSVHDKHTATSLGVQPPGLSAEPVRCNYDIGARKRRASEEARKV